MNIADIISNLRLPKIFREVLALFGGVGFYFLLWIFKLRNYQFSPNLNLNRLEIDILLITIIYLTGKSLLLFSKPLDLVIDLINYLGTRKLTPTDSLRNALKDFFIFRSLASKEIKKSDVEHKISIGELWKAFEEITSLQEAQERDIHTIILCKFLSIYAIIGMIYMNSIIYKLFFGFIILYCFIMIYSLQRTLFITSMDIQKHIAKEKFEKDKLKP